MWVDGIHDIFCQSAHQMDMAFEDGTVLDGLLIGPELQNRSNEIPGLCTPGPYVIAELLKGVELQRWLPDYLAGLCKLGEEVVRKHGYWIIEPKLHVPPAPICKSNYFESESLTITVKVPGVYLFNKSFWIQLGHAPGYPIIQFVLHLPLLRVTRVLGRTQPEVLSFCFAGFTFL